MKDDASPPEASVQVATVGRPHGVKGELRLLPESRKPDRLLGIRTCWLVSPDGQRVARFVVKGARSHAGAALLTLEGIADRDAAAAWTHAAAWALPAELPAWEQDEFSVDEVAGWQLVDRQGEVDVVVGAVTGVATNAGRDYFEVAHDGRSVLVPAVKDWLVKKDPADKRIVMRLPAGLLDA